MSSTGALYPALMLIALGTCSFLLRRFQSQLPITGRQKIAIGIGAFCGAMIGAKLPFVAAKWPHVLSATAWLAHGKTILAGIVGGYLGVEIAKRIAGVTVKTGDTFAVPVAVAVAIGRVGCCVGGCCYGIRTELPWGMHFHLAGDSPVVLRHPTQLYEAGFHIVMAMLLISLLRRGLLRGQLIKFYLLCYLTFRFLTEWLRPEIPLFGGLTGYQWAALALVPVFGYLWWRDARCEAGDGRLGTGGQSAND